MDYRNSFIYSEKAHHILSKNWVKANVWNMSTEKKKRAAMPRLQLVEAPGVPDQLYLVHLFWDLVSLCV